MNTVNLKDFDIILINTSAGKDSAAMLGHVWEQAVEAGVEDRLVAVHADLGRVEWGGVKSLALAQCDVFGVDLHFVKRDKGDLLDQIEARGMFPSSSCRFCTSDQKRDQIAKLITKLANEKREELGRQVKVLNCMGLRAQESSNRAKKEPFKMNKRSSNGKREVWDWLPIHAWTVEQVWDIHKRLSIPHHHAYDLGMPRLSCAFCIFAPKAALVLAGKHNQPLLEEYVRVEEKIGHKFRQNLSLAEILEEVKAGADAGNIEDWNM